MERKKQNAFLKAFSFLKPLLFDSFFKTGATVFFFLHLEDPGSQKRMVNHQA